MLHSQDARLAKIGAHWGLMPRTSSQIFMKVNMSTLVGMEASWAFVKWYSELASVVKAKNICQLQKAMNGLEEYQRCFLTFAALLLADVTRVLQVVQSKDVLHLSLGVDDGTGAVLDAGLNLLAEELFHVVWLFVRQKSSQVLNFKYHTSELIAFLFTEFR